MIMCEMKHTNAKNLKTMQFVLHITNSSCKTLFDVIMFVIMDGSYQWILSMISWAPIICIIVYNGH